MSTCISFVKKTFAYVSAAVLLVMLPLVSCEVGLGASVDTEAPTVSASYPPANAIIRGTFVLSGACHDDKALSSVTVTLTNTDTDTTYAPQTISVASNASSWTASINKYTEGSGYNGWQLPDGKYSASVYSTDASGRSSSPTSLAFEIDNTAPVFIMSSPAVTDISNPTAYGSSFKINGTIADDHSVKAMTVTVFSKADPANAILTYTIPSVETAGGTSVLVAKHTTAASDLSEVNENYNKLYTPVASGTQVYYCSVSLSDSAQAYTGTSSATDSTGNTTTSCYLNDSIYNYLINSATLSANKYSLAKGFGLEASDLKHIINGTYSGSLSSESLALIKKILSESLNDTSSNKPAFSLNPDANPKYIVSGFDFDTSNISTGMSGAAKNYKLTVNASAGRDNINVRPETMVIYLFGPYDAASLPAAVAGVFGASSSVGDPEKYAADNPGCLIQKEDNTSYVSGSIANYNMTMEITEKIVKSKYYLVALTGTDQNGLELDSDGKTYGFVGLLNTAPPVISITTPTDAYIPANKAKTVTGTLTAPYGLSSFKRYALDSSGNIAGTGTDISVSLTNTSKQTWTDTLSVGTANESVRYVATDTDGQQSTADFSYKVDVMLPRFTVTNPSPLGSAKVYNKANVFQAAGTAHDDNTSGSLAVYYLVSPSSGAAPGTTPVTGVSVTDVSGTTDGSVYSVANPSASSSWTSAGWSAADIATKEDGSKTWLANISLSAKSDGEYSIYVAAVDEAGNVSLVPGTIPGIYADSTVPALAVTKVNGSAKDKLDPYYTGTDPIVVEGALTEVNLSSFTVTSSTGTITVNTQPASGADQPWKFTIPATCANWHDIVITASDKAGFSTQKTLNTIIDSCKPTVVPENLSGSNIWINESKKNINLEIGDTGIDGLTYSSGIEKVTYTLSCDGDSTKNKTDAPLSIGASYSTYTIYSATVELGTGTNTISFTAVDKAGNMESTGEYTFRIDTTLPTISPVSADSVLSVNSTHKNDTYPASVTVTASDANAGIEDTKSAVALYKDNVIQTSANITHTAHTDTWKVEIPKALIDDGQNRFTVRVYDLAGNYNETSNGSAYVIADYVNPVVAITAVTPTVNTDYVNGTITVVGNVTESNLASLKYSVYLNNSTTASYTSDDLGKLYNFSQTIDTTKWVTDTTKTPINIVFTATDAAENTGEASTTTYHGKNYTVDQATDKPVITLTNASDSTVITSKDGITVTSGNLFNTTSNNKLLGTITDDDSIAKYIVSVDSYDTASNKWSDSPVTNEITPASTTASIASALPNKQGYYKVVIDAYDANYDSMTVSTINDCRTAKNTYYVGIDNDAPLIAISADTPSGKYVSSQSKVSVTGTASDSFSLASVKRYGTSDFSGAGTTIDVSSGSWTDTSLKSGNNGATVYYVARDVFGKQTSVSFEYKIDSNPPTFTVTGLGSETVNLGAGGLADKYAVMNSIYQIKGTAADEGSSGLRGVYYYISLSTNQPPASSTSYSPINGTSLNDGWKACTLTSASAWTANIDLSTLTAAKYTLYLAAADEAGNISLITGSPSNGITITPDNDIPSSTFASSVNMYNTAGTDAGTALAAENTYLSNKAFTLSGTIAEKNFKSASLSVTKDGGTPSSTTITAAGSWTYSEVSADGLYVYTLTMTDMAGNTAKQTITVRIDTTGPSLEVKNPSAKDSITSPLTMQFYAPDSGSGLGKITYTLVRKGTTDTTIRNNEETATKTGNTRSSAEIDFTGTSYGEGTYELTVKAADILGNTTAASPVTFYYDKDPPSLTETGIDTAGKTTNAAFTLSGKASDTNKLESLTVEDKLNDAVVRTYTPTVESDTTWSLELTPSGTAGDVKDGIHSYTITAKDVAGKTTTLTRSVTADKTNPYWKTDGTDGTVPYLSGISYTSGTNNYYKSANVTVTAKAADSMSGVAKLQYRINNGAVNDTGNGSFSTSVPNEGSNTIEVYAVDAAGNSTQTAVSLTAIIDTKAPTCSLTDIAGDTSHLTADTTKLVNGSSDLTFKVALSDGTDGSGVSSVTTAIGGTDTGASYATGTITISAAKLATGTVIVTVKDFVGNSQSYSLFQIQKDSTKPVVSITSPASGSYVNKTITVSGTATDNIALGNARLEVSTDSGTSYTSLSDPLTVSSDGTWSFVLDTNTTAYDTTGTDKAVTFRITATDTAGNQNTVSCNAVVNQNKDRPVIKLGNITLDGKTTLRLTTTVSGSITDDDGTIQALYYTNSSALATAEPSSENTATEKTAAGTADKWVPITVSSGTWTADTYAGDGSTSWYFCCKDAKGAFFYSIAASNLGRLYFTDSKTSDPADTKAAITFTVDTQNPELQTLAVAQSSSASAAYSSFSENDWVTAKNHPVGGGTRYLYVKAVVLEETGMDNVTLAIGSGTIKNTEPAAYDSATHVYTYFFGPIDTAALTGAARTYPDGVTTLQATATDKAALPGVKTFNIVIDNTAPSVDVTTPGTELTDKITSTVTMKGTASDNAGGSGLSVLKYIVPTNTQQGNTASIADTDWKDLSGSASWSIPFDGSSEAAKLSTYANTTYSGETTAGSKIWKVPVYFLVKDSLGNTSIIKDKYILYDELGGYPLATILYPEDSKTTGGTINAYGAATDDVSVSAVYVQLDINNDGAFNETDYNCLKTAAIADLTVLGTSTDWYIKASGTNSWKLSIDSTKLTTSSTAGSVTTTKYLDGTEASKNDNGTVTGGVFLGIRVRAIDGENKVRAWDTDTANKHYVKVQIDQNVPSITDLRLVQYSGNNPANAVIKSKAYASGMYISGKDTTTTWYLTGKCSDDICVSKVAFTNISSYTVALAGTYTDFTGDSTDFDTVKNSGEKNGSYTPVCYFHIPLTTSASGLIYSDLTVTDNQSHDSIQNIRINIDSTSPSLYNTETDAASNTEADLNGKLRLYIGTTTEKKINGSNVVQNSNTVFTFGDTVTDDGSKLAYIAFYFKRSGASTGTRVYCPMYGSASTDDNKTVITTGISASSTSGTKYINTDGLAVEYLTGTRVNSSGKASDESFRNDDIKTNFNIRSGGLVKIAGAYSRITAVDRDYGIVTFTPAADAASFTSAEFVYAQIVDHQTTEGPTGTDYTNVQHDDGDGMIESIDPAGSAFPWTASIFSDRMPDGPAEIHVVAIDNAGNITHGSIATTIQNSRPRLTRILVGTDLDHSGKADYTAANTPEYYENNVGLADGHAFGEFVYYSTLSAGGMAQSEVTVNTPPTKVFKVKNNLYVVPEFTGTINKGLGALYAIGTTETAAAKKALAAKTDAFTSCMLTGSTNISSKLNNRGAKLIADEMNEYGFVYLDNTALTSSESPSDTDYRYVALTFWDQTEETTQGYDSQYALLKIPVIIDVTDNVPPTADIKPFHWKDAGDNSLYGNSSANGHIELEGDLPTATFSATSGLFDIDPKVSGKIRITGDAYDETLLNTLYLSITDMAVGGTSGVSTKLATYDTAASKWTYTFAPATDDDTGWANLFTANGWTFRVTDSGPTQSGHSVTWELDIDTANTSVFSAIAGTDKVIAVTAYDTNPTANANKGNMSVASTTQTTTASLKPYYRMDVVPYISAIHTPIRTSSGLKDNNIRSASGKYSIIYNATGVANFITVNGFNLNPNAVRVVDSTTAVSNTVSAGSGISVSYAAGASPYTSFTATNAITKSGYLEVFTNSVRSLNNINNNDSVGLYTTTDTTDKKYAGYYNREPDYYTTKNTKLTDDRYLRMFNMKDTGIKNGYYPDMLMNGSNPVFGYIDLNGVNSAVSSFSTSYPGNYMPQRAEFDASTGKTSDIEYLIGGLAWDQMAMAKDSAGKYIHATVFNYADGLRDGHINVIYDKYAEMYSDGWGDGNYYSGYSGQFANGANNNAISLEAVSFTSTLIGRYQNMKLLAKGDSTTTAGASLYMAYFDDNTSTKDLIFRTFKIGSDTGWTNKLSTLRSNLAERNTSGRISAATSASKYFDIGVTSDNIVVFVYYDTNDARLKLVYSNVGIDGSSITPAVTWNKSSITFPDYVGNYVSMAIDGNNGIHIAAYDAGDSNLVYMYLPSYNSTTLKTVTVDQAFSVGNWTQIKVKGDKTNGYTPYIAYYNATETGSRDSIKLAYCNSVVTSTNVPEGTDASTGYTTGNWDYLTVPTLTPAQGGDAKFKQVNLGFDSSGIPVVGYLGTNIEFGKWMTE